MKVLTSIGSFIIREAEPTDLKSLVDIHIKSWNATYPTCHPKPTAALREMQWLDAFEKRKDDWFCYVAQKLDGVIAGFATGHNFKGDDLQFDRQLDKIHILKPYHRLGLGKALVSCVVQRFTERGFNSMVLFADPGNKAIKFYDDLGGERLVDEQGIFNGAFGWRDLKTLQLLLPKL